MSNAAPSRPYFSRASIQAARYDVADRSALYRPSAAPPLTVLASYVLDGVPVTIKDSVAMKGWPYFHGIGANRNNPPSSYDSPPAARLQEGGATIFAKTTMPDCGLLAAGVSSLFGIIRNPWGTAYNTGGSSAGAGAVRSCPSGDHAPGAGACRWR